MDEVYEMVRQNIREMVEETDRITEQTFASVLIENEEGQ